jgi:hypothetical protein
MARRRARVRQHHQAESVQYVGPPTVVSLEWDYGYLSALVNRSRGVEGVSALYPADLGLSDELAQRLMSWLDRIPHWDVDVESDPE